MVGAVAESQGGGIPGYQAAYLLLGVLMLLLTVAALGLKSRAEELATLQRTQGDAGPAHPAQPAPAASDPVSSPAYRS